jgi:hypothetical protein
MRFRSPVLALLISTLLGVVVPLATTASTATVGPMRSPSYQSLAAAGSDLLCGIRVDETLDCWGRSRISVADYPEGPFFGVSASRRAACGLRANETMQCWGRWYSDVAHDSGLTAPSGTFSKVDLAEEQACAIRTDGTVTCFGGFDSGSAASGGSPIDGTFIDVAAIHDDYGGCGIQSGGSIVCWGDDTWGQADPPQGAFTDIAAGRMTLCAIAAGGELECWGRGLYGAADPPDGRYRALAIGGDTGCAISVEDDRVACWGADLGDPPDVPAAAVAVGDNIAGMVGTNGVVHTWGEARLWAMWGGWEVARPRDGFGVFRIIGVIPAALQRGVSVDIALRTTAIDPAPAFRIVAGELPRGLRLTADGHIIGVPDVPGRSGAVTIVADNGKAPPSSVTISLSVDEGGEGVA